MEKDLLLELEEASMWLAISTERKGRRKSFISSEPIWWPLLPYIEGGC